MIALLQRVLSAGVTVDGLPVANIGAGLLVFLGIEKDDQSENARKLQQKLLNYRLFADENDKMNHNVQQAGGEILLVSQFTLAANTKKGLRPSFASAMPPAEAEKMFLRFAADLHDAYPRVQRGIFGADMKVSLVNDGPVTFWLQC